MVPPSHSSDDFARVFGPDEGLGIGVSAGDEVVDRVLELLEGTENTTLEAPLGQECEQTFDCIEPRGGSRGEVEDKAWMAREQFSGLLGSAFMLDIRGATDLPRDTRVRERDAPAFDRHSRGTRRRREGHPGIKCRKPITKPIAAPVAACTT